MKKSELRQIIREELLKEGYKYELYVFDDVLKSLDALVEHLDDLATNKDIKQKDIKDTLTDHNAFKKDVAKRMDYISRTVLRINQYRA